MAYDALAQSVAITRQNLEVRLAVLQRQINDPPHKVILEYSLSEFPKCLEQAKGYGIDVTAYQQWWQEYGR